MIKFWVAILFSVICSTPLLSQEALVVDEFGNLNCDHYLMRMDGALEQGRQNPTGRLVFIVYEGREVSYNTRKRGTELMLPKYGAANAKFRSMRTWLKHRGFPLNRASFVSGGFREQMTVEIWLVPKEGSDPVPTPSVEKMKYGRGKPIGFCTDCCGP